MTTSPAPHKEISPLLRLPQVLAMFPVSRSSWWAGIKESRYPAGIKIAPRTTAWRRSDIEALIASLDEKNSGNA